MQEEWKSLKVSSTEFSEEVKNIANEEFNKNALRNPQVYSEFYRDFFVWIFIDGYIKGYSDGATSVMNDMKN
jgi:hypothetical protein